MNPTRIGREQLTERGIMTASIGMTHIKRVMLGPWINESGIETGVGHRLG